MSNAPICHVSQDETIGQPAAKQAPIPSPPTDLKSALNAITMLINTVRQLQNQVNNGGTTISTKKQQPANWIQLSRVTENVKVTNPDDPTQYVMVERINRLAMQNHATGETWVWIR